MTGVPMRAGTDPSRHRGGRHLSGSTSSSSLKRFSSRVHASIFTSPAVNLLRALFVISTRRRSALDDGVDPGTAQVSSYRPALTCFIQPTRRWVKTRKWRVQSILLARMASFQ